MSLYEQRPSEIMAQLGTLSASPRPKRKQVLHRRLRRGRSSHRSFLHVGIDRPGLTLEQAEQIKARFLAATRTGIVVTPPYLTVTRIR